MKLEMVLKIRKLYYYKQHKMILRVRIKRRLSQFSFD